MGRLFILTGGDEVSHYMAAHWGTPIYQVGVSLAEDSSLFVDPTREDVDAALDGKRVVAFFGHGSADALGSPAVIDRNNIHRATGIVVALACRSGRALGPAAVSSGSRAYVGFGDDIPVIDSPVIDSLVTDGFARLLSGREEPVEFELAFWAACEEVQDKFFSIRRDDEAFLVGQSAQVLKMALRVFEA